MPTPVTWEQLLTEIARQQRRSPSEPSETIFQTVCKLTTDSSDADFLIRISELYAGCSPWAKANPTLADQNHSDLASMQHSVMAEAERRIAYPDADIQRIFYPHIGPQQLQEDAEWLRHNTRLPQLSHV